MFQQDLLHIGVVDESEDQNQQSLNQDQMVVCHLLVYIFVSYWLEKYFSYDFVVMISTLWSPLWIENAQLTDKSSNVFDGDCIFIHHSMMLAFASKKIKWLPVCGD